MNNDILQPTQVSTGRRKGWFFSLSFLAVIAGFLPLLFFFWPDHQQSQILKTGVPADATILQLNATGNVYNNQPQARVTLRVEPKDSEAFQADVTMVINPLYIPQFQPGMHVKVRYDANDHSKVAIEETENGWRNE